VILKDVCFNEDSTREKNKTNKEIETPPAKTTIVHTKKEKVIVKTKEYPRKPWYFARV